MTRSVTIDRIEGDLAMLEVGEHIVPWPVDALPAGVREGDQLTVSLTLASSDPASTAEANARLERLRQRGPSSDEIDL